MTKKFRNYLAVGALMAMAMGLAHAQTTKIRVGNTVTTDVASAALFDGIEKGEFSKEGLEIETRSFIQSNQKYDTFKGGGIDVDINMGAVNAAQLYSAGVPLVVLRAVAPADIWAVVTRQDSTLTKPEDFKGKRFGVVSLSGTNYGVTYFAFKSANVDLLRDVKVSTLPPAGLIAALERGEVDGATLYEPYLSDAVKSGRVKIAFRPGEVYQRHYKEPFVALAIVARKDFYEKNKAAVGKFVEVMERQAAGLDANIDAATKAFAEAQPDMKMTPTQVKDVLSPYVSNYIRDQNDPVFVRKVQNLYDRLLEIKQLPQPVKAAEFWIKP